MPGGIELIPHGLSSGDARDRLAHDGPNSMPEHDPNPFARALDKLWAPVPWMLEAAIVLQLILHQYPEVAVIAALLLFNGVLGFFRRAGRSRRFGR
jgi:H+-transporting ATPase